MPKLNTTCLPRLLTVVGATLISALFACAQQTTSPTGQESLRVMTQMDTNKDQQVTKEEYMKYQENKFEAADKNKDKTLNEEEWFQHQLEIGDGNE
jgi:hypothetical protein